MTKQIVHRVLLVDLADLARLWETPEDNLGLEVSEDGKLVPILIDEKRKGGAASLREMLEAAKSKYPNASEFDPVVVVYQTGGENEPRVEISTVDAVLDNPRRKENEKKWWTFTNEYPNRMN